MNFNEYQTQAGTTAIYPEAGTQSYGAVSYVALGLAGEAGEVAGKVKKVWRDNNGVFTEEKVDQIADELSDCLWYIAALASELGFTLEELAEHNLDKLFSRKERGVLGGSGDNR